VLNRARQIFFSALIFIGLTVKAQTPPLDSLKKLLATNTHDTLRCYRLATIIDLEADSRKWEGYNNEILSICQSHLSRTEEKQETDFYKEYLGVAINNEGLIARDKGDQKLAEQKYLQALKLLEETNAPLGMAGTLNNLASLYEDQSETVKALEYYEKGVALALKINEKKAVAALYYNMGRLCRNVGNIPKAVEMLNRAIQIATETNDKEVLAGALSSMAIMYKAQGEYKLALELYEKNLAMNRESNDVYGVAQCLSNIGILYKAMKKYDKTLEYFNRSRAISEKEGLKDQLAKIYSSIGLMHTIFEQNDSALFYFNRSLDILQTYNDKDLKATCLGGIGEVYLKKNDLNRAESYALKALALNREIGYPAGIKTHASILNKIYHLKKDPKNELIMYELYIQMKDSINHLENKKASIKAQLKYEYEKQAAADSVAHAKESEIKNVELKRQSAEIKAKKNQQLALFGGLALVIVFALFMYNRFKITQKQKLIIEQQKEIVEEQKLLVEEKQEEILDSIRYAKRIQSAQLPQEVFIAKTLNRLVK
jgi:tetratricopeptide (TPR) repeat protein